MDRNQVLETVKEKMGFVPNMLDGVSKGSPAAAAVYVNGVATLADSNLTAAEQQVVQLAVSVYNECGYCTSAHSVAGQGSGISREDVQALRAGGDPSDQRLAAVAKAARMLLDKRGHLSSGDMEELEKSGVTRGQVYDIISHIGLKIMTNWFSHIDNPEIDEQFRYSE